MRKNYYLRAAALLLACCMVSLCLITGTTAKWTMKVDGGEKWIRAGIFSVAVKTGESGGLPIWTDIIRSALGGSVAVPLTETVYQHIDAGPGAVDYDHPDEHPYNLEGDGVSTGGHGTLMKDHRVDSSGAIVSDTDYTIIAPGCWGQFTLTIKNFSEVDVTIALALEPGWSPGIPLQWRVSDENGDFTSAVWDDNFDTAAEALQNYPANAGNEWFRDIQWRWKFEQPLLQAGDALDTGFGVDAASSDLLLNVPIAVSITQID